MGLHIVTKLRHTLPLTLARCVYWWVRYCVRSTPASVREVVGSIPVQSSQRLAKVSAWHSALLGKDKYWFVQYQGNVTGGHGAEDPVSQWGSIIK